MFLFQILVSLFIVFLITFLVYCFKSNYQRVLDFKTSIILLVIYTIIILFYLFYVNADLEIIYLRIVLLATVFLFKYIYIDYLNSINEFKNGKNYIFPKVYPYILSFVFIVDSIQVSRNFSDPYSIINEYDYIIKIFGILYVFYIVGCIIFKNIRIIFSKNKLNKSTVNNISSVFTLLFTLSFMIFTILSEFIYSNVIFSCFIYTLLVGSFIVNSEKYVVYLRVPKDVDKLEEIEEIEEIVDISIDKHERKLSDAELIKQIHLDDLTGLYNKEYIQNKIITLENKSENDYVLVIGVTGLKFINESFSYERGDEVLQELSIIISDLFDDLTNDSVNDSIVGRIEGSNFVVITRKLSLEDIEGKIETLKEACNYKDGQIINLSLGKCKLSSSFIKPREMLDRARNDMYLSKCIFNRENQVLIASMLHRNFCKKQNLLSSHLKRSSELSRDFVNYLGLNKMEVIDVVNAALIHDIALTMMPNMVDYNIDFDTKFDKYIYRTHVSKGVDIAMEAGMNSSVTTIILHHHENYDGTGYPYQLKGDEIPKLASIVSIIDLVDMILNYSDDFYKVEEILLSKKGVAFSEELVYNMIAFLKEHNK